MAQSLLVVRLLRLLRVFRVLKLAEYLRESRTLAQALRASRRKIAVFLLSVMTIVVVVGTLMYVIEGEEHGFTSIPISIYWAVVTLTTVGYGDLAPATTLGPRARGGPDADRLRHHRGADRDRDRRSSPGRSANRSRPRRARPAGSVATTPTRCTAGAAELGCRTGGQSCRTTTSTRLGY